MLSRPAGVKDDGTAYSVDYGLVNGGSGGIAYKKATGGQVPSALLQDTRFERFFIRKPHHRSGSVLTFAPGVLDYLMSRTDTLPG
jgi:hypothetical protein